jgi:hypothetical protein
MAMAVHLGELFMVRKNNVEARCVLRSHQFGWEAQSSRAADPARRGVALSIRRAPVGGVKDGNLTMLFTTTEISERRYSEMVSKFGGLLLARRAGPSWIARKVAELGALLRQLPDDRQRAFVYALDAPGGSENDDRQAIKGRGTGRSIAPERPSAVSRTIVRRTD